MRAWSQRIGLAVALLGLVFSLQPASAQDDQETRAPRAEAEHPAPPDLADLIPASTALSERLAELQKAASQDADLGDLRRQVHEVGVRLDADAGRFAALKASSDARVGQLAELRAEVEADGEALSALGGAVTARVRSFGNQRREWLEQQAKWSAWQAALGKDDLEEIAATVTKAQQSIASALALLRQQLKPLFDLQEQIGFAQNRVDSLSADVAKAISLAQGGIAADAAPAMLSAEYVAQLRSGFETGFEISSGAAFLAERGWVVVAQAALSLILALLFVRTRSKLERIEHWRFVARRPIAAGALIGTLSLVVFYGHVPDLVRFVLSLVIASAFLRLMGALVDRGWRRDLLYSLGVIVILTNLCYALGVPLALFRLYLVLAATAVAVLCLRWARQSRRLGEASIYRWVLHLGALFFVWIALSELRGRAKLAEFLFVTSLRTLAIVFVFGLLRHVVRGGLEWAVGSATARGPSLLRDRSQVVVQRTGVLLDAVIGVAILSLLLMTWQVYESPGAAISGLLSTKVAVGAQEITIGLVLLAGGSLAASYLASGLLQTLLTANVLARRNVDTGVSLAVSRLLHYALISGGFVVALAVLGVDLTKIVLLVSALGVGIGFGLQTIVNNFVCGLILLFERPLRVGDTIELGGRWAKIAKIGLRSTTVRTLDQADVIVPNTDLVSNQVTNWTLTDRHARGIISVKVAVGSDVPRVMQTLKDCALAHPGIMKRPEPWILFRSFSGGSLDLELHVWLVDVDDRLQVESDLYQGIEQRFREAGIAIPS